jgi:hypothetical protein
MPSVPQAPRVSAAAIAAVGIQSLRKTGGIILPGRAETRSITGARAHGGVVSLTRILQAPTPDQLRRAMSSLPTGVTIVTSIGPDGPAGATANAVGSLSLEPPLMLACLDRGSRTLAVVRDARRFGISVLAAGQGELARAFASKASHGKKFREVEFSERSGVPILAGTVAWAACGRLPGSRLILGRHWELVDLAPLDQLPPGDLSRMRFRLPLATLSRIRSLALVRTPFVHCSRNRPLPVK